MNPKKFVADLSTIELSEGQIKKINSGIENLVSSVLLENIQTKNVKLAPLGGLGGGGTNGIILVEEER